MAVDTLSPEDQEFLTRCEDELKDRYTEKDDEFMSVFNSEPSKPPIMDSWWTPNNFGRYNDRRNHRKYHPWNRSGRDSRDTRDHRGHHDKRDRGYNDYDRSSDSKRPRYR